jgi:glycyl-tRNA synthetase beta chain
MAEYLFELLTEEIPAWMHDAASETLRERLSALATELGVDHPADKISVESTSRRIAFVMKGLPEREEDREQEIKGPPKKTAYDASGAPTQALQGFLRKQGVSADDILPSDDEYVRVQKRIAGRDTRVILHERIPAIMQSIRWPKMMRWGNGEFSYIRPAHSIVSLFNGEVLGLSLFGIDAGNTTEGHRILGRRRITVANHADYIKQLQLAHVIVESGRRQEAMVLRARELAREVDGTPSEDASIWGQWQYLTEFPGVVRAEFRPEFLALPEEVLVTVMRVHQKQLPIRNAAGKLTHYFLAVMDNEADPAGNAAYGNSFVTNARFADAQFFYETDRRRRLEERLDDLSRLQFQEKLGNYLEKTRRIETIATAICAEMKIDAAAVHQAARLCKSDLVTEMVKEFTDLQGRIGGIYAREEGLPEKVWQAIYDHYQPVSMDDPLPRDITGAIVSLADRIDTLTGFFIIGAKPTGSKDPFALRRAAQGVVQILLNRDMRQVKIGIDRLIDIGLAAHGQAANQEARQDLLVFFAERVRTILELSAWGFAYDEIAAAMESGWGRSLTDLVDRISALRSIRNDPNFLSLLDSAKRIENITAGHESDRVDASLLEHETERRLADLAIALSAQIDELAAERRYGMALESFAALAPELEKFFQDVMVMVDDPKVRDNRKSLLRKAGSAALKIADVTKIVVDRRDYRP